MWHQDYLDNDPIKRRVKSAFYIKSIKHLNSLNAIFIISSEALLALTTIYLDYGKYTNRVSHIYICHDGSSVYSSNSMCCITYRSSNTLFYKSSQNCTKDTKSIRHCNHSINCIYLVDQVFTWYLRDYLRKEYYAKNYCPRICNN